MMFVVFLVVLVASVATFLAAFAYDYTKDWGSKYARNVGAVAWCFMLVGLVGAVATSNDDEDVVDNKVRIECVVGDDQALTCEVLG